MGKYRKENGLSVKITPVSLNCSSAVQFKTNIQANLTLKKSISEPGLLNKPIPSQTPLIENAKWEHL